MPRKKLVLPPVPVEVVCLNCDETFEVLKTAKLFCKVMCRDDAKLVRYFRACKRDGRIDRPDIKQAIQIRFGFALSDIGYDEKSRKLSPAKRAEVFERDNGRCRECGEEGTEIDHIAGRSDDMGNLQLLCQTCHFRKTEKNMIQLSATDDKYAERKMKYIKLMLRIMAEKPVRECDDDIAWNHRPLVNERQQAMQNARILGMLNQAINNPALQ